MPAPLDPECIFGVLRDQSIDYVLIGGLAAVLHGSTAMTNDADIVPAKDEANLVRLSTALRDSTLDCGWPTLPTACRSIRIQRCSGRWRCST